MRRRKAENGMSRIRLEGNARQSMSNGHVSAMRQGCAEAEADDGDDDVKAMQSAAKAREERASGKYPCKESAGDRGNIRRASARGEAMQSGRAQLP